MGEMASEHGVDELALGCGHAGDLAVATVLGRRALARRQILRKGGAEGVAGGFDGADELEVSDGEMVVVVDLVLLVVSVFTS